MSIDLIVLMSFVTVAAATVTISRVASYGWMVRHATTVDLGFTATCLVLFYSAGVTGMLIAILSGLVMTVMLSVSKRVQKTAAAVAKPRSVDDEYVNGEWIYNLAPYLHKGELA